EISLIIVVAIGFFIFSYGKGWGADWKRYMANDFGGWFYDAESITRPSKDTVRVWGKTVYTDKGVIRRVTEMGVISQKYEDLALKYKDSESKYEALSYELPLFEFNCATKKSRTLKGTSYSRDGLVLDIYAPEAP